MLGEGWKNLFYTCERNLNITFVLEQLTAETTESDPMSVVFVKIHCSSTKINEQWSSYCSF